MSAKKITYAIAALLLVSALLVAGISLFKKRASPLPPRAEGQSVVGYPSLSTPAPTGDCASHPAYAEQKGTVQISILFGYKDTRPSRFVADGFERASLVQQFLKPCRDLNTYACGFTQDPDELYQFHKDLMRQGKSYQARLRIVPSSLGPDDEENRALPQQILHSRATEKEFLQALNQDDAVFYIGHSRDGGGPDFAAPKLTLDGHVDYPFYVRQKRGLEKMLHALEQRPSEHPLLLGMMSCSSSEHFAAALLEKHEKLTLISSGVLIYYTDALANTWRSVDQFLGARCAPQFAGVLRSKFSKASSAINVKGFLSVPHRELLKKPLRDK